MVFELVNEVTGDGDVVVRKYVSNRTGLTSVIAHVEGPLVHGYLTVATEAHDDEGIPHTLEHLVFVGSESYPFKGVLDLVANRCMADGTNAWTDTDHTCYTMQTAGADGFLSLLPIYLDHVLYPTLTDSAYVTEVHHINGEGDDSGVVYCEMQGRENTGDSRVSQEMLRSMYPGHCGYKSETGGILKDIRSTLSNENIRKYHREFYRPENLCVIVAGNVKEDDVLQTLTKFEEVILERRSRASNGLASTNGSSASNGTGNEWIRPWQSPVPPLTETVNKTIEFPCDDDDNGLVYIGWRGPSCVTEQVKSTEISLLFEYLNDTAASPLQQAFVERNDAYCSSVSFSFIENSTSCMYLTFESVVKEKLTAVKDHLFTVLDAVANGTDPINLDRMGEVIHRQKLQLLATLESSPHFRIASAVIGDFLYGNQKSDLESRLKEIPILDACAKQPVEFWTSILKQYFVGDADSMEKERPNFVHVIGKPSPDLKEKMSADEKERVKQQAKVLGEEGLKARQTLLNESKTKNEIQPPKEMISSVPVPSTEGIQFFTVTRHGNDPTSTELASELSPALSKIPFRIQVDDLKTNFVTLRVLLNSSEVVPPKFRLYLPLLCNLLTESSINRNGTLIPFQEVVTQLAADTISSGATIGVGGSFSQLVLLSLKVEQSKYLKGINWLRELLFETQFLEERIKVIAKRMVSDIALMKRKGQRVAGDMMRSLNFDEKSNVHAGGCFRQFNFLNKLLSKLATSPEGVITDLKSLRNILSGLENITVHVSLNAKKVQEVNNGADLYEPWISSFLPPKVRQSSIGGQVLTRKVTADSELVLPDAEGLTGVIAGVGSVDSNYLQQTVRSISSFTDSDVAPLMVLIQYLTQLEGPMWREIRGVGLSYHYSISLQITEGLMYFLLYKSTHVGPAYKASLDIIDRHIKASGSSGAISGSDLGSVWDLALLESSRSSLVFELIEREKSLPKVSLESLLNHLKGVDMNYTKNLLTKVSKVTLDDVKRVAPTYLLPLFDTSASKCALSCNPSKVNEIVEQFARMDRKLVPVQLEDAGNFVSKL